LPRINELGKPSCRKQAACTTLLSVTNGTNAIMIRSPLQQEVRVMVTERVVAFGFLTDHDLKVLGSGFSRHFPIQDENLFADLIEQLDRIEIERLDKGIIIRPPVR
jgi:hypothetical protein